MERGRSTRWRKGDRRFVAQVRRAIGAIAFALWLLVAAPTALAHDELGSSAPASGEHLDVAPASIELHFGGQPMSLGATVIVAGSDGTDWVAAPPTVAGAVVSVPVADDLPDGHYDVRWRVVSADGAVISGHFPFSVGDTTNAEAIPDPASNAAASRVAPGAGAGDFATAQTRLEAAGPDSDRWTSTARTAAAGTGGALLALAAMNAWIRRRRNRAVGDVISPPQEQHP
jgi:methionine-rich copper-binding protein CopC